MTTPTSKEVDEIAAAWAARIDRGELTAEEEQALARWLDSDVRNRGAFMRMRAIALYSERARALGPAFEPAKFARGSMDVDPPTAPSMERDPTERNERSGTSRNRYWQFAAGLAAVLIASIAVLMAYRTDGDLHRYDTRQGEIKVVSLSDGSVITLNTASRIEVSFDRNLREVRLIHGEALFEVAKDAFRPFVVAAGDALIQAVGTSFVVQRLPHEPVNVLVREGIVEVQQPSSPSPIRLTAHMRAELSASPKSSVAQVQILPPEELHRELAWRDGRIIFEAETLRQAAAAFAQYSDIRIVIEDDDVARMEITGLFAANDPVKFARSAAKSLGLRAEIKSGEVYILKKDTVLH